MIKKLKQTISSVALFLGFRITYSFPFVEKVYGFRHSRIPYRVLSKSLLEDIDWVAPDDTLPPPVNDIAKIWMQIPGGHKTDHYFPVYEKIFAHLRATPIKILEIGVLNGASLKMWREYFHPDSVIVGLDIDARCRNFEDVPRRVHVRIGAQEDHSVLRSIIAEFGKFDVVIDDGSHMTSHMIASFNCLFPEGLNANGIYFVEDTCTNYWKQYRDTRVSFVELAKQLIDIQNRHYEIGTSEAEFRLGSASRIRAFHVPRVTTMIGEIRFFDSIVVIYKNSGLTVPVIRKRIAE